MDDPTGNQLGPSHKSDAGIREETHLKLTQDREEQVLTQVTSRREGDEDERGDQIQKGALEK
jgi:hypothetical protein